MCERWQVTSRIILTTKVKLIAHSTLSTYAKCRCTKNSHYRTEVTSLRKYRRCVLASDYTLKLMLDNALLPLDIVFGFSLSKRIVRDLSLSHRGILISWNCKIKTIFCSLNCEINFFSNLLILLKCICMLCERRINQYYKTSKKQLLTVKY